MTSQGVKLIMLLTLATLMLNSLQTTAQAAATAAAESNNRNSHHHDQQQEQQQEHNDEITEKSQEYAKAITATATETETSKVVEEQEQHIQRRHHQRHHNHKQYLTRESATNYHQQKQHHRVQHDNNNNNNKKQKQSVNITQKFETQTHKEHPHHEHQQQEQQQQNAHQTNVEHRKQQHHHQQHQQHHQQQHHHQHEHKHEHDHQQQVKQHENKHIQQYLSNHDRHSRALYLDLKHNNKLHLTAPAPATTTDDGLLHLTLNQANEDKLVYNDIAEIENAAAAAAPAISADEDNDYDDYDNYDYDDEALVAIDLEDRRHFAHKVQKQSAFASNNRMQTAFAARRVPRDHHNVATRWNAINIDSSNSNSNEEDYPSDQPSDEPVGAITQRKINELGTPERADVEFKKQLLRDRARLHQRRIAFEASCSQPKPRVIYIRKKTTDLYFPSGTILHRCDESAGCCPNARHICGPKTTQIVSLPFEVKHSFNGPKEPVEVPLVNHTACYCDEPVKFGNDLQMRRKRSHIHIVAPLKLNTLSNHHQDICRCPKHFESVKENDRQYNLDDYDYSSINSEAVSSTPATKTPKCSCDCHPSDNHICQRLKKGEEGFAVLDRKCISKNECSPPICSHGIYNRQVGRCPHANSNQRTNYEHFGWRHYSFD